MKFGDNLKSFRKSLNLSQESLADKVGVTRQSVSKWETGEAYPEMSNIIALCSIFKCSINDLVNNNLVDLDSLGEEIKMSVVKFQKEKQKKMKVFSKVIYVISKILKIMSVVGIASVCLALLTSIVLIPNIKYDNDTNIVQIFDKEVEYNITSTKLSIGGFDVATNMDEVTNKEVISFLNESKASQISFVCLFFISVIIELIFIYKLFETLERLFNNINTRNTPFVSENVIYIKKIALYLLLTIVIPDFTALIAEIIYSRDLNIDFAISSYLYVAIVYVLSYIFEYGYLIQLDSKGKMYGEEDE